MRRAWSTQACASRTAEPPTSIRPDPQTFTDRRLGDFFRQEFEPVVPILTVKPIVRISRDHLPPSREAVTRGEGRMYRYEKERDLKPRASRLLRWLGVAGLAGTALVNSGCITTGLMDYVHNGFKVGPNYCKPPAPVAEEWIQARDPRTQGPPPPDGDW